MGQTSCILLAKYELHCSFSCQSGETMSLDWSLHQAYISSLKWYMGTKHLLNYIDWGKLKNSREKSVPMQLFHHKSHVDWPKLPWWEAGNYSPQPQYGQVTRWWYTALHIHFFLQWHFLALWSICIHTSYRSRVWGGWLDSCGSGQGPVSCSGENSNETSESIKAG
jgi:hypothetical protein